MVDWVAILMEMIREMIMDLEPPTYPGAFIYMYNSSTLIQVIPLLHVMNLHVVSKLR